MGNSQNIPMDESKDCQNRVQITKSLYMTGVTCQLAAHKKVYSPLQANELKPDELSRISDGHRLNILARELFPNGIDASNGNTLFGQAAVDYTRELIDSGVQVIYEAAFQSKDGSFFFRADILDCKNKRIIEVKSASKPTEEHILECAFYEFIMTDIGIKIEQYQLAHVNTDYVRREELEVGRLFCLQDITDQVRANPELTKRRAKGCRDTLQKKKAPRRKIGEYCLKPRKCSFYKVCFTKHNHRDSVMNITGMRQKQKFSLIREGIVHMNQIPTNVNLSEKQLHQVKAHMDDLVRIDKTWLSDFISGINSKRLFFLDFETYTDPVPEFFGMRPYQQVPFQYSLHTLHPNGQVEHREFLGDPNRDPRKEFICSLVNDLKQEGTIIAYNKSFEVSRIHELRYAFREHSEELLVLINRMADIMIPFRDVKVYSPQMQGSYSLKAVLPAFVPNLTYQGLAINNGALASTEYRKMKTLNGSEREQIRKSLLEYCKMDTLALLEIWEFLQRTIQNEN